MSKKKKKQDLNALKALMSQHPLPSGTEHLFKELQGESDRSVALVCTSLLDAALAKVISQHTGKKADKLLAQGNPLGTFSARIDAAAAFGTILPGLAEELDIVREVRNAFAHSMAPVTLSTPAVTTYLKRSTIYRDFYSRELALPVDMDSTYFILLTRTLFLMLQTRYQILGGGKLSDPVQVAEPEADGGHS